jgi:integrase
MPSRLDSLPPERKIRGVIAKQIAETFGRRRLVSVRPSEVQAWVAELSRTHSAATARHSLGVLRRVFDYAVRDGVIQRNPAAGIRLSRVQGNDPRPLTHDERWRLAGQYTSSQGPAVRVGRRLLRAAVRGASGTAMVQCRPARQDPARCSGVFGGGVPRRVVAGQEPPGAHRADPRDRVR